MSTRTNDCCLYSPLAAEPELAELVELFVEEMPERIDVIERAFQAKQKDVLLRAAHQLKGAAGSYGFERISPLAAEVEEALRLGKPELSIKGLVESLLDTCRMVRAGVPRL